MGNNELRHERSRMAATSESERDNSTGYQVDIHISVYDCETRDGWRTFESRADNMPANDAHALTTHLPGRDRTTVRADDIDLESISSLFRGPPGMVGGLVVGGGGVTELSIPQHIRSIVSVL